MRRPTLDQVTNVVLTATCLVAVMMMGLKQLQRYSSTNTATTFVVGQPGPKLEGVQYKDGRQTLVMYVRSTCEYCTASMPLYRTLVDIRKGNNGLRLVAASVDIASVTNEYLTGHGVLVDAVVNTLPAGIPTPTLVLVDASGAVRDVWVGKLPPDRERAVVEKLKAPMAQLSSNLGR